MHAAWRSGGAGGRADEPLSLTIPLCEDESLTTNRLMALFD